jgi:hypothetical protein
VKTERQEVKKVKDDDLAMSVEVVNDAMMGGGRVAVTTRWGVVGGRGEERGKNKREGRARSAGRDAENICGGGGSGGSAM